MFCTTRVEGNNPFNYACSHDISKQFFLPKMLYADIAVSNKLELCPPIVNHICTIVYNNCCSNSIIYLLRLE